VKCTAAAEDGREIRNAGWTYPGLMRSATPSYEPPTVTCAIERTLAVVGERWSLLILREAHAGATRFADFQANLGIATNVLVTRLRKLVAAGVFEKGEYQVPGDRARPEYHLTPAGRDLGLVLGALQQWGDDYIPLPKGPISQRCNRATGKKVAVSFIDERGSPIDISQVQLDGPGAAGSRRAVLDSRSSPLAK
jgi:DNA-binding HxlR family transcriptional regulator